MGGSIWDRFTHDPRSPEFARLRASDRDRDVVHDVLATAYSEGRLTPEELEDRSSTVVQARTLGELPGLIDDLVLRVPVAPVIRDKRLEAERRYRMHRQQALVAFLVPTLICWVVWSSVLLAGAGTTFPWPAIVTVATSVRLVQLLITRQETIDSIQHRLEKKERKRFEARQRKELRAAPPPPDQTT